MKKFSLLFIVLIILNVSICFAEQTEYNEGYNAGYDDGYSDGKNSAKAKIPLVKIIQPVDIPEVNPGEVVEFNVKFKNESNKDGALNLHITPQIEDNNVLIYERPLSYSTTVTLKPDKEGSTIFKVKTSEEAKKGTYALKLKLEYKNTLGEIFTRDDAVYFRISTERRKPILNVTNLKLPSKRLNAGENFNISFDITNIGGSIAKDVEVKLEGFSNDGIMPINSNDYSFIDKIDSNKSALQAYAFRISEDITTKDNTITASITYKDSDDKEYTTTKNFYITDVKLKEKESGEKKEEEKKEEEKKYAKPKMIISSYNVNPNRIIAGEDFTFSFVFKNTSKEKDIRNIKATISSKDGCFNITKGSNTFYIEKMSRSQSVSEHIELKAKQDLTSNSYAVIIDFDYEDYDGNEYSSSEVINIPVIEYSKLVINSANVSEGYIDAICNLSFDFVNMGKATISNLTASVTGDYVAVQENTYIGNIQAGNSDYYDIEVKPTKEGTNFGTLILTFEDSSGRQIEVTRTFEGTAFNEENFNPDIINPNEPIINPDDLVDDVKVFETWQIVLAGIGAFVVTFILARLITKKILLKKFEDEI